MASQTLWWIWLEPGHIHHQSTSCPTLSCFVTGHALVQPWVICYSIRQHQFWWSLLDSTYCIKIKRHKMTLHNWEVQWAPAKVSCVNGTEWHAVNRTKDSAAITGQSSLACIKNVMSINYKCTTCDHNTEVSIQQSLFKNSIKILQTQNLFLLGKQPQKNYRCSPSGKIPPKFL